MLAAAGFAEVRQLDERVNPRNDYTRWASFSAVKPAGAT
jgi:hypothetical protein